MKAQVPTAGPLRLYQLLDSLVALRLEYANGSEDEMAIASLGRGELLEVRTVLDTAIHHTNRIIGDVIRQRATELISNR
jgi:hypothetical protein